MAIQSLEIGKDLHIFKTFRREEEENFGQDDFVKEHDEEFLFQAYKKNTAFFERKVKLNVILNAFLILGYMIGCCGGGILFMIDFIGKLKSIYACSIPWLF